MMLKLTDFNLEPAQTAQLEQYCTDLLETNSQYNLTGIRDRDAVWTTLFLDSLSVLPLLPDVESPTLIDVGTGAGFLGLVLKIMRPDLHLTLVESVGKKARFCESICERLGMEHVRVLTERAEAVGQDSTYREQFDIVVARALAPMPVLVEYLLPLARVGGQMIAQKGPAGPDELLAAEMAIQKLGGRFQEKVSYSLPGPGDGEPRQRHLYILDKHAATPGEYPRHTGVPSKRPL